MKLYLKQALVIFILITSAALVNANKRGNTYSDQYILTDGNITDHVWSSDGNEIAYVKCPDGQYWGCELWKTDSRLENKELLLTGVYGTHLEDWEGEWILLGLAPTPIAQLDADGRAVHGELWKVKSDGSELVRITSTYTNGIRTQFWNPYWGDAGTVGWARFVPGTNLVYFSAHDGNGWWAAHTTTDDGTDTWSRILYGTYSFTIGMSPSGNKLLWGHAWYYNQPTTLYSSNNDGSDLSVIKNFNEVSWPLVLSDDFTVVLSSATGIRAIDLDGTNERDVIVDQYHNSWSDYNPIDSEKLLMTSDRDPDGNWHIFEINVDGSDILQITSGAYVDQSPLYSVNSDMIAYRRVSDTFTPVPGSPPPYELVVVDMVAFRINKLIQYLQNLMDTGALSDEKGKSLIKKLWNALKKYHKGELHDSVEKLGSFTKKVNKLVSKNRLSEADGEILVSEANKIIAVIKLKSVDHRHHHNEDDDDDHHNHDED